ncbi:MAG TPA: 30S ribosomal protein S2 [Patescibacteria group bacterium]|nr:30S ribosomal protein S2 [Patescibacteria group bacterium]
MRDITLEELLEAGCHFGHQVNRRNPKADDYIFEARSNIHIINLEKTRDGLLAAAEYLKELSSNGGYVVVVGTKRQARQVVQDEALRAKEAGVNGLFYVNYRWIGGILTNFPEVSKNFKKLRDLSEFLASNKRGEYTKRELVLMEKEVDKLKDLYGGVVSMDRVPDALVIIGTQLEATAVREAISNGVKTVGVVDTNADPNIIDYPIPANDDAVGSIKLITSYLVDAWIEGSKIGIKKEEEKIKAEEKAKVAHAKAAEDKLKKETAEVRAKQRENVSKPVEDKATKKA